MNLATKKISSSDVLKNMTPLTVRKGDIPLLKSTMSFDMKKALPLNRATVMAESVNDISPRGTISAVISTNVIYDVGTVSAGTSLLLQLTTKDKTKISFQSAFAADANYMTTVFYLENDTVKIVTQSQNLLGNFDIDAFLPSGGIYYIQVDVTAGGGQMTILATEMTEFSALEPNDNLFQAAALTPAAKIEVSDFFDNANDWDFYAITSPAANSSAYVNFAFDNNLWMNGTIQNPSITLIGFYMNAAGNVDWQISESMSGAVVDRKITFANAGTYLIGIYHANQNKQGQLNENYTFSVGFTKKANGLLSGSNLAYVSSITGSIDYGYYDDLFFSEESIFWINGCAFHILGSIANWAGGAGKILARIRNDYDDFVYTTLINVDSSGSFAAIIPLPKCQNRSGVIYHGEHMEFNSIAFLGAESINRSDLYNPRTEIVGMSFQHKGKQFKKNMIVGVCYDPI